MNSDRDLLEEVAFRLRYPKMGFLAVNILYYKLKKKMGMVEGVDVVEEDWDNLVVLDACRYDAFAKVVGEFPELSGELQARRSKAPYTRQFLRESFQGRTLHNTVYLTANPQLYDVSNLDDATLEADFHATIHSFLDGYDPDSTEPIQEGYTPEHTTATAKQVNRNFPNKRLIVHYLPPHWPFFGEKGQKLFDGMADAPWEDLTAGKARISHRDLWTAYLENLRIGLENIAELVPELEGKTVITADHGQLLGDRTKPIPVRGYGHPGVYTDALVKVPWFVCEHETRKRIVAEPPVETAREGAGAGETERRVKETLQDLGYVTD